MIRNYGALLKGIRTAFGLTGEAESPSRLGDTINTVFDPWRQIEHAALRDEIWCAGYASAAAGGAGTRSWVQLWNPADSNRILVLERFWSSQALTLGKMHGAAGANIAGINAGVLDLRLVPGFVATDARHRGQVRYNNNAAAVGLTRYYNTASTGVEGVAFPVVIAPNCGFHIDPNVDNSAIVGCFVWRERDLLPGEQAASLR